MTTPVNRTRLKVLARRMEAYVEKMELIVDEIRDMAYGWETGPESSREETAPALSGGDCCM